MTRSIALDPYVIDVLLRDLVNHDHAPSAFLVYLWLWARTDGGKRRFAASLAGIALETGLSKSSVQAAIRHLRKRGYLATKRSSETAVPVHTVLAPWRN